VLQPIGGGATMAGLRLPFEVGLRIFSQGHCITSLDMTYRAPRPPMAARDGKGSKSVLSLKQIQENRRLVFRPDLRSIKLSTAEVLRARKTRGPAVRKAR
jgi:hypothetical protein